MQRFFVLGKRVEGHYAIAVRSSSVKHNSGHLMVRIRGDGYHGE